MGRKSWATLEERKFLDDNVNQYELAQEKKKTTQWLHHFHVRYLSRFPLEATQCPGDDEILRELTKKVS